MESQPETFHLFGDIWVSDPQEYLLPHDYLQTKRAIALIHKFKQGTSGGGDRHPWDFEAEYQHLVREDTEWWRNKNAIRPEGYIVHPSGSLGASVTCLLFNPTFSVEDPFFKETFDPSNATIRQMERVGFNPSNALFIDQIARREISDNVRGLYPEDLWQIHERFLKQVWNHMQAIVVICWGSAVRGRLLGTPNKPGWFKDFEVVRLWGRYSGLELFLELTPDLNSVKRFVIFVSHPSYFFFIQSDTPKAKRLRQRIGRPQDLALEVAAKLAQIQIEPRFYELSPKLVVHLGVPHRVSEERGRLKGEAAAQLQSAFPEAKLLPQSSHRSRGPNYKGQNMVSPSNQYIPGKVCTYGVPREVDAWGGPNENGRLTEAEICALRIGGSGPSARQSSKPMKYGTWLIRSKTELGTLPELVELKCPSCSMKRSIKAKWTIGDEPELSIPYLLCGAATDGADGTVSGCNDRSFWVPVADFKVVRQPYLSRMWTDF